MKSIIHGAWTWPVLHNWYFIWLWRGDSLKIQSLASLLVMENNFNPENLSAFSKEKLEDVIKELCLTFVIDPIAKWTVPNAQSALSGYSYIGSACACCLREIVSCLCMFVSRDTDSLIWTIFLRIFIKQIALEDFSPQNRGHVCFLLGIIKIMTAS